LCAGPRSVEANPDAPNHRQLKQEGQALFEDATKQSLKPEQYEEKLKDFLERANELGKSSLATYVAHRKVILDSVEAAPMRGEMVILLMSTSS
jgi:hypothetical protein